MVAYHVTAFDCIPVAHENSAMFSRPSFHVLVIQHCGIGGSGNETSRNTGLGATSKITCIVKKYDVASVPVPELEYR